MEIPPKNRIFVICIFPTSVYTANNSTGQLTPEGTNHIPVVTGSREGGREGEREGEREDGGRNEGREREGGRKGGREREEGMERREQRREGRRKGDRWRKGERKREREGGRENVQYTTIQSCTCTHMRST